MSFNVSTSSYNYETKGYDTVIKTYGEGTTLRTWMASVQIMSDVWETACHVSYWDEAEQRIRTQTWAKDVRIDATDEVLEKVKNFIYNCEVKRLTELAEAEAQKMHLGSVVEVISGRSGKGTRGKVVVAIERPYGMGWRSVMAKKLAIATSDVTVKVAARNGKVYENYRDVVWAWARNCQLVEVPEIDLESVKEGAKARADREIAQYVTL
jgi:hypothetical protein